MRTAYEMQTTFIGTPIPPGTFISVELILLMRFLMATKINRTPIPLSFQLLVLFLGKTAR
jgi:hypothetical protein